MWKSTRREPQTILVVEDDELSMRLLHDILEVDGYAVLETEDGMEALKLARQNKPALILMDIHLPEVSGLEVIKWMKAEDALKRIPIIAITASAMKGDEEKIRRSGCDAYIAKPISLTDFRKTVQRFVCAEDH
jgi:two-component system cell cycle response regulator DivK